MRELSLFTGAGGGILGTILLGWKVVGCVEWDDYCQRLLRQRMEDGLIETAPIFSDIRAFISEGYAESYKGMVDVITAGFPCPAFSRAGKSQGFKQDELMYDAIKGVQIIQPSFILWENVEGFTRWKDALRQEIENLGYEYFDAILNSLDFGVAQNRPRYFMLCVSRGSVLGSQYLRGVQGRKDKGVYGLQPMPKNTQGRWTPTIHTKEEWRNIAAERGICRKADGVAHRMDRLRAIGNGQVPRVVATAWELLNNS